MNDKRTPEERLRQIVCDRLWDDLDELEKRKDYPQVDIVQECGGRFDRIIIHCCGLNVHEVHDYFTKHGIISSLVEYDTSWIFGDGESIVGFPRRSYTI